MMGRFPCCNNSGLKKGPWTPEEDEKLIDHINKHGHVSWRALPKLAGLNRCGKSCRLRWTNYLRPDIKRGKFTDEEGRLIINLHSVLGNKWSMIASHLPGRTDNEIKNFWNTHLRKKLLQMGIDPVTHRQRTDLNLFSSLPQLFAATNLNNLLSPWDNALKLQADATQLAKIQLLHILLQVINTTAPANMEAFNLLGSNPFQQYQLNEYPGLISQFEGNVDGPLAFSPNPTQIPINFSNLGAPHHHSNDYQAIADPCVSVERMPRLNENTINNNHLSGSNAILTANPIPALVSDSPECSTVNQMESKINPTEISTHSSTSTTIDAWGEFNFDDQAGESYWRDIIEQASSPSWPLSSS